MLINLRNALMAGKRLPYDAEVEYLESTGTQWITIPITLESTDTIGATFTPRVSSSNGAIYCSSFGNRGNLLRRDKSGNLSVFSNGGSNAVSSYVAGTEYTVVWGNRRVSVNGTPTTVPYNVYLVVSPETSISLFATATGTLPGYCAISHFYIDGKLDLIPVRKGTVGYLYDRVSGKLFGNAGSGDFVVGPDVVPVEYIESHGTEWIDTGVEIADSDDARFVTTCTITNIVHSTSSTWVGSGVLSTGGLHYVLDQYGIRTGGGTATNAIPYNRGDVVTIDVYYDSQHRRTCKIGQSIYQGTAYSAPTAKLAILDYSAPTDVTSHSRQAGNLFHVEVYKSSALVRKFLPVRVGSGSTWEGALIDTLTRRIYRNAGTGAFTYGNDLKYPIPAT